MRLRRVLIANRGEIAIRIARACREAGIETVAVYSDPDTGAPHTLAADDAVRIGPAAPSESYLNVGAIIDAARAAGADAVHPGYGFLSERATFAAACEEAGLIFIGPSADTIARMGSKIGARQLMEAAGVPVVPGLTPADQSDAGILDAVSRIGFPSLVKASAGGGGKGMRALRGPEQAAEMIAGARREAESAFGDGTLYVERLVDRPRHIEIQIFGDSLGNVVHLFERECSIQRRHQKVVEESPSPALVPRVREQMGAAAVAAARAVNYRNAGTVEFLLEGSGDVGALLLSRDEHPPPGRACGHRGGRRRRPRSGATRDRGRRAVAVDTSRTFAARSRNRVPRLCRGPGERIPAAGGNPSALP